MSPVAVATVVALSLSAATCPWWATATSADRPRAVARGARRSREALAAPLDAVLLLDLVDVAIAAGASVPGALAAVGEAIGGDQGEALTRGATGLLLGAPWQSAWAGAAPPLAAVVSVLEPSWTTGSAPGPALRGRADQLRRERRARARAAAGALGVHLVLPLGLCFLPAFVLLGLVPMILSLAGDLFG
ncbi:MAG: type II secretion system F family protein [Cellulomonas sp.]